EEVERELEEEVRLHVELEAEELVRGGMSPAEASREALRRFGGVERTKERVRDERGGRIVDDLLQDLRYGLRTLRKSPRFAVAVLLTLGLGIGANTAIFTVVDGVLLRPLPFEASDRLVYLTRPGEVEADVSLPDVRDWRAETSTLESVGLYMSRWALDLTGWGTPERLEAQLAEPELFEVYGAPPVAGRYFDEAESRPGADPVVVLSEDFWQRRFGGDPDLPGRTLTLNDRPFTVVGVAPRELDVFRTGVDAWVPAAVEAPWAVDERGTNNFNAVGRLAAGATLDQARAEMRALSLRLAEAHPRTNTGKIAEPVPLRDFLVADARPALLLLLGAVGLVLLIACVNLASLLLVRATRRDAELAVRRALGGSRGRIARQLLWESGLLALGGGAMGILLSRAGTEALLALAPQGLPRADVVTIDGGVLAFALALVAGTTLLCGLVPALYSARRDPASVLQSERRGATSGRGHQRFLDGLVVSEITLALVLLVGAGLLMQSYRNLRGVDLGFEPAGRVALNLTLPESEYGRVDPQNRFFHGAI
ncbi:MAG: FtsX-like permease family protein, partial [Gemmatimonadetes bacterium]|nr:FtsX-like permease family protein [Gemmatimonadota bacterium]NIR78142.1 FtsX-like permease family protein [Gemmatimonadota bacterium]NIT86709.1 FtsX-like permease family protein [Gemmatimonadota bacterium]NIU30566.1 FtsX-like permease family protein [Gemmatimonadota bacterium]NIU35404.1 FtsX-like permease family protein [Gemmatimonadota bacterium]